MYTLPIFTATLLHLAIFMAHGGITMAAAIPEPIVARDNCCFAENCKNWALDKDGRTISSTCWDKKDQRHWYEVRSALDLAHCVTNRFGILAPDSPGGFDMSCQGCTVTGTILSCDCKTPYSQAPVKSKIDLNDFVADSHGRLACFDYTASIISRREVVFNDTNFD